VLADACPGTTQDRPKGRNRETETDVLSRKAIHEGPGYVNAPRTDFGRDRIAPTGTPIAGGEVAPRGEETFVR
jgi:hypothetical protein